MQELEPGLKRIKFWGPHRSILKFSLAEHIWYSCPREQPLIEHTSSFYFLMERRLRRLHNFHLKKPWRKKRKHLEDSLADPTRTVLEVLKESADACPPLKSAVGAVIALWDVHRVSA